MSALQTTVSFDEFLASLDEGARAEWVDGSGWCRASRRGVYRSSVLPDFRLRVSWLWESPLPSLLRVLREPGLEA